MAIKGKARTRARSRRVVAAPPRPPQYIRKRALWARRSTWILAGVAALAGLALLVVFFKVLPDREKARNSREAIAVQTFAELVKRHFPPSAQPIGSQYQLFPTFAGDIDQLAKTPQDLADTARGLERQATKSSEGVDGIDVKKVIPDEFPQTRVDMIRAQFLIRQSFDLYRNVAESLRAAAGASRGDRAKFVEQAKSLATKADGLFAFGWQIVINAETRLGIPQPRFTPPSVPPVAPASP